LRLLYSYFLHRKMVLVFTPTPYCFLFDLLTGIEPVIATHVLLHAAGQFLPRAR
jgi:hypothetical protein